MNCVFQVIDECPSVKLKLFMPNDRYSYRTFVLTFYPVFSTQSSVY